jgi:uncharacterized protein
MSYTSLITDHMLNALRAEYTLNCNGIHGYPHWVRVWENGQRLAKTTAARIEVVELFAFLHDIHRRNDSYDPQHGSRAAEYVDSLQKTHFALSKDDLKLLRKACAGHSDGHIVADITVQTCWDTDRLDLGRAGIQPLPERLCTPAARGKEIIAWAYRRSLGGLSD